MIPNKKKMFFQGISIFSTIILTMSILFVRGANVKDCDGDHNCPHGYYCFKDSLTCAPCTDCNSYYRKPIVWNRCIKHPKDCGPCLPGYEEEILTEGKIRELCLYSGKNESAEKEGVATSPLLMWIAGVFLIGLIVTSGGFVYCKRKSFGLSSTRNDVDVEKPSPPPYSPYFTNSNICQSSAPACDPVFNNNSVDRNDSIDENHALIPKKVTGKNITPTAHTENESCQQSIVYRQPDYMFEEASDANNTTRQAENENIAEESQESSSNVGESDEGDVNSDVMLSIHDQETQPSSWTPSLPSGSQEMNFSSSVRCLHSDGNSESENQSEEPSRKKMRKNNSEPNFVIQNQNHIYIHNVNNNQNLNVTIKDVL